MGYNTVSYKLPNKFSLKFQKKPRVFISNYILCDLLMGYNKVSSKLPNKFSFKFQLKPRVFILSQLSLIQLIS